MYNDLRLNSINNRTNQQNDERNRSKHSKCTCCPYGYHIDLDFVRYCESLELDNGEQDTAAYRRRERRRQRQSMEVLLGLIQTPANTPQPENDQKCLIRNDKYPVKIEQALEEVVSDFERTLASHKTRPEPTELYISNTASHQSINAPALQTIREQMALSLQKMRRLEEQVQAIPRLEFRISALRDVNQLLKTELKKCEEQLQSAREANKKSPLKRDAAITCSVITREIGIGTYHVLHNDSATQTHSVIPLTKSSQTQTPKSQSTSIQCSLETDILHIAEKRDVSTQANPKTSTSSTSAKPIMVDAFTMPQYQKLCDVTTNSPISLHALTTRSKSFNLGEGISRSTLSKTTQTIPKTMNQLSQYEVPTGTFVNRSVQLDKLVTKSKMTSTEVTTTDQGCQVLCTNSDKDTQTSTPTTTPTMVRKSDSSLPTTPTMVRRSDSFSSRIPRPQTLAQTPPEQRRLKRQITYTKIPAEEQPVKDTVQIEPTRFNNEPLLTRSLGPESFTFSSMELPESSYLDDNRRDKATPSKEMRAAMKVVNDCLLKNPTTKNNMSHLKSARNIIQQEWFKISSIVNANPLNIEDYMDSIEEVSNQLLHYVVNMNDNSGNTAMHYAVSHGNFDVVSILLDSKVCDINRPNSAGYTPIMLLSLAEVRSPSHSNVIRKLFQLADVNVKAKQHGQTALMLAVSHGRTDMASLLLEAGADVNIQDEDGSTALMCAAEHGHIDIVRLFLAQPDCDSAITDLDGSTALKIALEAGHRDIGVLLYAHERMSTGASPYASLHRKKSQRKSQPASPKLPRSPIATAPTTPKH